MKKIVMLSLAVLAMVLLFAFVFAACSGGEPCEICGENPCVCPTCDDCGQILSACTCIPCEVCGKKPSACVCIPCEVCHKKVCICPPCNNCGEKPCVCITVWTGRLTVTAYEAVSIYRAPTGNAFTRSEFSQSEQNLSEQEKAAMKIDWKNDRDALVGVSSLTRNSWTTTQISNYIQNTMGFSASQATTYTTWFISNDWNWMVAGRNDNNVDVIVK